MRKLIKLSCIFSLIASLFACTKKEKIEDVDGPLVSSLDWRYDLKGPYNSFEITYDHQECNIIVEAYDVNQLNFYFDSDEEELYATLLFPFGSCDRYLKCRKS